MENFFNVKYIVHGDRYEVGHKGYQTGNRPWAIDWHHKSFTLNDLELC